MQGKKKVLASICLAACLALPMQTAQAAENWHALPASGQGGAYIDGSYWLYDNDLLSNHDGTLYVSMGVFASILECAMPNIDWENGIVTYQIYNSESESYETVLTVAAKDGQTQIYADGSVSHWQHQPYWQESIYAAEGALPNLMLPLREACQSVDIAVEYRDGIVFVGKRHQALTVPDAASRQALLTNMTVSADEAAANPYSLAVNNGQIIASHDYTGPNWQAPHKGEGALFLARAEEGGSLLVQEWQSDGIRKTLYTLPDHTSMASLGNHVKHLETAAGEALRVDFIDSAQSQYSTLYLIQPDGTLKPVLGSSLLGKTVLTQDQLYYIQNWNFGGRSQLLTVPLAGGETSSKLDREDLSYQDITLLDKDHLLVKAWMREDKAKRLFVLDLVSGQYQPLTEQSWQECAVDGDWVYGLDAADNCIYRFHIDGSGLTRLTEPISYFGETMLDGAVALYVDEAGCLHLAGDQNKQISQAPVQEWQIFGQQVYYCQSGATAGIYVYDLSNDKRQCLRAGEYRQIAVSKQGQLAAVPAGGKTIVLYQDGAWQVITPEE